MKNFVQGFVVLCLLLVWVVALPVCAEEAVNLKFGAMPVGSSWYVYAATYTTLLEKAFPEGSTFEVIPQGGGIANPLAVAQGKANVALANVATSKWAYDGIEMYEGKAAKNIRALAGGLNKVWLEIMFREDFIEETGMDSLQKIAEAKHPLRLICKPEGSTAPPTARRVLAEYGMSFDTIKEWGGSVIQVSGGQIPEMMREGRADVWFEVAPPGHPAVTEGMLTADLRMFELPEEVLENLAQYGLYQDVIPANTFNNQPKAIKTVNPGTVIIVNESMPEDVAYEITKVICENKDELVAAHASIKTFEPTEAWKPENTGIPLHPGAERYYKEQGWME